MDGVAERCTNREQEWDRAEDSGEMQVTVIRLADIRVSKRKKRARRMAVQAAVKKVVAGAE
jgi:hypothetical protein